ncbi:MAG: phosphatidate cytidylyltransferase, partial [Bacteroidales bacterium]|nr:phosphatidate cytidylyltransferase [Bacteroidales bacterium]
MTNFIKRTLSGIGFVAVMLAAFLINEYVFGAVMLLALVVMMKEFLLMTCGKEYWFSQIISILSGSILFILVFMYRGFDFPGRLVILAFIPVVLLMINSLYVKDKSRFDKFSNLYTAILYIAVPWSFLNFAAFNCNGEFNGILLLCFFAIIWGSDVGAYLFGITLGQRYGRKLFPSISPKKSWIGFWGGLFMAVL